MKLLRLLLLPLFLFAFSSKFTPHLNYYFKDLHCDRILHKRAFDICYSCKEKHPLAVAYTLYGNLVNKNKYSRSSLKFRPDYDLPAKCRSYSKDYSKTGFDRGHNAPNAAFDYNRAVQKETFLMSNISPQKPVLNRKYWAKTEKLARHLAVKYKKVEVVTGSCGSKGYIKNGIGIPAFWYKVIIIPGIKTQPLVFLAPNINTGMAKARLKDFSGSVYELRKICGF